MTPLPPEQIKAKAYRILECLVCRYGGEDAKEIEIVLLEILEGKKEQ